MIRRPRRPAQVRDPPLAPGWDKYKASHASWYRNNRPNGQAYRNYLAHCKYLLKPDWVALDPRLQVIYHALDKNNIPPDYDHEPPQQYNQFAWPGTVPCPAGHLPPPPAAPPTAAQIMAAQPITVRIANHQLVTATAAPPPAVHLTNAQTLAALAPSAQLATIRVVGRETERARQGYRQQVQSVLGRPQRRTVFPILREAGNERVPELRPQPQDGFNSTIDDDQGLFGVTPYIKEPTGSRPWICPGSSDPTSTLQWEPKRELGQGTEGRAILWLKKDRSTNKIIDRVVTKDLYFAKCWAKRTQWTDDERTTPMEAAIHAAICEEQPSFFIRPRGFRIRRELQVVRIATEFTHMGDLCSLLKQFAYNSDARGADFWKEQGALDAGESPQNSSAVPQSGRFGHLSERESESPGAEIGRSMFADSEDEDNEDNEAQATKPEPVNPDGQALSPPLPGGEDEEGEEENEPIPEHFVWLLFRAFIASTIIMHNTNAIHLDLHYGNILLGKDSGSLMGNYGVKPLIADFGMAMPVQSDAFDNPADFRMKNKEQTWAPEQIITHPRVVDPPAGEPAIGKHTSVFHLGVLIHSIVNGGCSPEWDEFVRVFKYRNHERPFHHFNCIWKYRQILFDGQVLSEDRYLDEVLLHCHSDRDGSNAYYRAQLAPFLPTIKRCLAFNPSDRITLLDLKVEVEQKLAAFSDSPNDDAHVILSRVPKRRHSEAFDSESDDGDEEEDDDEDETGITRPTRRRNKNKRRVTGE